MATWPHPCPCPDLYTYHSGPIAPAPFTLAAQFWKQHALPLLMAHPMDLRPVGGAPLAALPACTPGSSLPCHLVDASWRKWGSMERLGIL